MGLAASVARETGPGVRIRKPARGPYAVRAELTVDEVLSWPWSAGWSLARVRALWAAFACYDAAPVVVDGMHGVVATLPAEGRDPTAGTAFILVEDVNGKPACARVRFPAGTSFHDALDMVMVEFLAGPARGEDAKECLQAFTGDEGARAVRLARILDGWRGDRALLAHLAHVLAARVSMAFRAARVTPRFRTALLALDAVGNRDVNLFRPNAGGDRIRAAYVSHPLATLHAGHHGPEADGVVGLAGSVARERPGFTPAHMRRVGGPAVMAWYRSAPVEKPCHWRLSSFFDLAAAVPPEWLPTDEEGLHAFDACASFLMPVRNASGQPLRQLVAPSRGDWHAFRETLTRDPWHAHLRSHMWFVAEDLGVRVLLPIVGDIVEPRSDPDAALGYADINGVRDAAKALARQVLFGGKSAIGALEAVKRLYVLNPEIQARMPHGGDAPARWPLLFEPLDAPNGLRLVSLSSAKEMAEEGAAGPDRNGVPGLDHCVASSVPSAAEGHVYFVSIRRTLPDGGYERVSTLQLILSETPGKSSVYQHRGRSNAAPSPEAVEAAAWLDETRPYAPWRAYRRYRSIGADHNLLDYECRYDWRDPRLVEAALDAWRPGLPRRLAGLDVAGIRAALDLDAALAPSLEARRANRLRNARLLAGDRASHGTMYP